LKSEGNKNPDEILIDKRGQREPKGICIFCRFSIPLKNSCRKKFNKFVGAFTIS
jgi:hypothetical protein